MNDLTYFRLIKIDVKHRKPRQVPNAQFLIKH